MTELIWVIDIAPDTAALSEAISERVLGRKSVVFDAAKPADWKAESAREKATKEMDQKASYGTISVSIERAIRASWQRVT